MSESAETGLLSVTFKHVMLWLINSYDETRRSVVFAVPIQAVAFLASVGGFLILLVILFMYLDKVLCFAQCGGLPCFEQKSKKNKNKLGE